MSISLTAFEQLMSVGESWLRDLFMSAICLNALRYRLSDVARRMPYNVSANAGCLTTLLQDRLHAHSGKSISIVLGTRR
jgi:hypothetical protein